MSAPTPVERALRTWLRDGGKLDALLPADEASQRLHTRTEVELVCEAIDAAAAVCAAWPAEHPIATLAVLASQIPDRAIVPHAAAAVLPRLRAWLDAATVGARSPEPAQERALRIAAMEVIGTLLRYGKEDDVERVARVARAPRFERAPWGLALDVLARYRHRDRVGPHPHVHAIVTALSEPLPSGLAMRMLATVSNDLVEQGVLERHPFDSADGRMRLAEILGDENGSDAARAAAFVRDRDELLARADTHRHWSTRLWSHWARAYAGDPRGLDQLADDCRDFRVSSAAQWHLRKLGREDRIPPEVDDNEFTALAELALRLITYEGNGRPPDDVAFVDARCIAWPPTNDCRALSLYRYTYQATATAPMKHGLALAGTLTKGLCPHVTPDASPDDAYALFCCWELQQLGDPRAPATIDVATGRALLDAAAS